MLIKCGMEWRKDPVLFAKDCFGFIPTPEQAEVMRAVAEEGSKVAIKSGVSTGKTAVAAILIIWFLTFHRPCKCVATSANALQLQDCLMPEIALWLTRAPAYIRDIIVVTKMRAYINGHEFEQFLTAKTARADKPDALQGLHSDHIFVVIDEAFGVDDKVIEVAWGALTKKNARLLMMGNPTRTSGYCYRAFNKDAEMYKRFTFSTLKSPLVSPEALEMLKKTFDYPDSDVARSRLLGEFPSGAINQVISMELACASGDRFRTIEPASYVAYPVILGVDTAWEGDDRSVIAMRQGKYSKVLFKGSKVNTAALTAHVMKFYEEYKVHTIFVDAGGPAAGGVIDNLRALGCNVVAINFGGETIDPLCHMKRTEIWFALKKWMEEGGAIEPDDETITDITNPTYSIPTGKKVLESKKQMKARHVRSPDIGDALALCHAFPVAGDVTSIGENYLKGDKYDQYLQTLALHKPKTEGGDSWDPFGEMHEAIRRDGGSSPTSGQY